MMRSSMRSTTASKACLLAMIREGYLDRKKQNALYQDDDQITAVEEGFAQLHFGALLEVAGNAQAALAIPFNRGVGRAFYDAIVLDVLARDRLDSR
jgi:hypothetical protein